jgi:hypothetical protein
MGETVTIALAVAVNDGIVLAADSATSLVTTDPATGNLAVVKVYNNANKIFNLCKGVPVGAFTYGAGSIGNAAISTIAKDFRAALTTKSPMGPSGWVFDPANYTVEEVAVALRHFVYDGLYVPAFAADPSKPPLGLNVAGYSSGAAGAEMWQIVVDETGACPPPQRLVSPTDSGIIGFWGQPEALRRLIFGFGSDLPDALVSIGLDPKDVPAAIAAIRPQLEVSLAVPAMPIQDAIDLAEYLVHLTIMYSRFAPGPETVGGPIEVAVITKHEGFKWVSRKHYWDVTLNPA